MVQVLEAFCARVDGLQLSEETCIATVRLMLAVFETPFSVDVSVAV
jgi:hypothetical protein